MKSVQTQTTCGAVSESDEANDTSLDLLDETLYLVRSKASTFVTTSHTQLSTAVAPLRLVWTVRHATRKWNVEGKHAQSGFSRVGVTRCKPALMYLLHKSQGYVGYNLLHMRLGKVSEPSFKLPGCHVGPNQGLSAGSIRSRYCSAADEQRAALCSQSADF